MKRVTLICSILAFAPVIWAHHMAPEDMQDLIEDQLIEVDSAHLLSSDDDPALLETEITTMEDVDYVVVASGLDAEDVTESVEDTLEMLDDGNQVCDDSFTIDMDADGTYTLTVYIDFCNL